MSDRSRAPLHRFAFVVLAAVVLGPSCSPGQSTEPLVDPGPPEIRTWVGDWRDEVIYQILTDRFENGDPANDVLVGIGPDPSDLQRHQGGDWRGIRERLDYISALGATAIWISPILENVDRAGDEDGYHGYWASDFTRLNPRFGDLAALRRLVNAAHARGIKVIVDIVTNHAGRVFNYDLDGDGVTDPGEIEPPYRPSAYEVPLIWNVPETPRLFADGYLSGSGELLDLGPELFRRRGEGRSGDPVEKVYGDFFTGLRDLDTDREDVIMALAETYAYWVRETDVDGFRVDAVPHQEGTFWPRFGQALRERLSAMGKERFILIGEVFSLNSALVASFSYGDGALDTAFDFPARGYFLGDVILGGRAPAAGATTLSRDRVLYRATPQPGGIGVDPWRSRVIIVDNHDTHRIRGELDNDVAIQTMLFAQFMLDGIPCIYYGTEQDFDGQGYALSRERMWDSGFGTDTGTFRFYRRLIDFRREHEVLRRGELSVLYASEEDGFSDEPDAGMVAWARELPTEKVIVVINAHGTKTSRAAIPTGFGEGRVLLDAWGEREAPSGSGWVVGAGGLLVVELPPRGVMVLQPE